MRLRMPWGNVQMSETSAQGKRADGSLRSSSPYGSAQAASISRQIRSLVPGQTLHGEIVGRNGSEVQIRLSDDVVIQARVDQNMNLEVGKNMTFEVRNNGRTLTLSPLFTNMSADVNVMKAIDMASLPLNETTVSMTGQMMEAGLPVDKASMQQMYREISSYPQAQVSDIVNLHRLGLPVNEANVEQMISYRSLTHSLNQGLDSLLEALPQAMAGMRAEGNGQGLSSLYQELFSMLSENPSEVLEAEPVPGQAGQPESPAQALPDASLGQAQAEGILLGEAGEGLARGEGVLAGMEGAPGETEGMPDGDGPPGAEGRASDVQGAQGQSAVLTAEGALSAAARGALAEDLLAVLETLPLPEEERAAFQVPLEQFARGELSSQSFFDLAGRLLARSQSFPQGVQELHRVFAGKAFQGLLERQLKNLWSIRPQEVEEPEKVEALYRRLDRQLKGLSQALESGGQTQSAAFRTAGTLSRNLDFLNQLNQMYAYVQLPLKMGQGEAHGELYVYTNKRSLAAAEGKITALLHLDMEHLGPVDVYVALEREKVNTRFTVRDDEMLDFLEAHMDLLTERLARRGYDCSFSMTVREGGQGEDSGIAPLLRQEKGMLVSQYAFDVRT